MFCTKKETERIGPCNFKSIQFWDQTFPSTDSFPSDKPFSRDAQFVPFPLCHLFVKKLRTSVMANPLPLWPACHRLASPISSAQSVRTGQWKEHAARTPNQRISFREHFTGTHSTLFSLKTCWNICNKPNLLTEATVMKLSDKRKSNLATSETVEATTSGRSTHQTTSANIAMVSMAHLQKVGFPLKHSDFP